MKLFKESTPEEKAEKARRKADRARANAEWARRQHTIREERMAAMPTFTVREQREVTVKAESMSDAIALASAAFKEGQSSDHTIKWSKPFGIEGDTIDAIRVTGIKAIEDD